MDKKIEVEKKSHECISNKDLFEYLNVEIKSIYDQFISLSLAVTGTLLLIIGWFITSENAQKLISKVANQIFIFYIVLISIFIIEVIIFFEYYKNSRKIGTLILSTKFLDDKYFDTNKLSCSLIYCLATSHLILYLFLCYLLHLICLVEK